MMTLQKLHDLALENNADFEELCYYALISATQNSGGNGVSEGEITSYADEYLKKELNGEIDGEEQNIEHISNTNGDKNDNIDSAVNEKINNISDNQQSSAIFNENNQNNTDIATGKQTQDNIAIEKHNDCPQLPTNNVNTGNAVNDEPANKRKVMPSLNTGTRQPEATETNNSNNETTNEDLVDTDLFDDDLVEGNQPTSAILQKDNHSDNTNNTDDDILMDDSLLLGDDVIFNDDIEKENNVNSDKDNQLTYDKDGLDNEYDDLMDDEIIFDDDK